MSVRLYPINGMIINGQEIEKIAWIRATKLPGWSSGEVPTSLTVQRCSAVGSAPEKGEGCHGILLDEWD